MPDEPNPLSHEPVCEGSSCFGDPATRRVFLHQVAGGSAALLVGPTLLQGQEPGDTTGRYGVAPAEMLEVALKINGREIKMKIDPRVSLLDALREHLKLTGTKKGCDHGQCGACTVLVNGRRINSCLSLALMHEGDSVTTIEGLGTPAHLHPMQAAFVEHDGYQCGYCTPGQICSAVGMLSELKAGIPSHVTANLQAGVEMSDSEIKERMSGNICRCAAYSNIVAAIKAAAGQTQAA